MTNVAEADKKCKYERYFLAALSLPGHLEDNNINVEETIKIFYRVTVIEGP